MRRVAAEKAEGLEPVGFFPDGVDEAEDFHERTKLHRATCYRFRRRVIDYMTSDRGMYETARNRRNYSLHPVIPLPEPAKLEVTLAAAMSRRRSCRTFAPAPLSLADLSSVLSAARVVQSTWLDEESNAALSVRPYASGGGLYAIEIYLIVLNCTDLKPCVVHYDPFAHSLSVLLEDDSIPSRLVAALSDFGDYVPSIGAVIAPTLIAERSIAKYGVRGYRFGLIEDGTLMASLALAATAAGVATCHGGGYFDDEINAMLGVDGRSETVIDCMAIGFAAPSPEV